MNTLRKTVAVIFFFISAWTLYSILFPVKGYFDTAIELDGVDGETTILLYRDMMAKIDNSGLSFYELNTTESSRLFGFMFINIKNFSIEYDSFHTNSLVGVSKLVFPDDDTYQINVPFSVFYNDFSAIIDDKTYTLSISLKSTTTAKALYSTFKKFN